MKQFLEKLFAVSGILTEIAAFLGLKDYYNLCLVSKKINDLISKSRDIYLFRREATINILNMKKSTNHNIKLLQYVYNSISVIQWIKYLSTNTLFCQSFELIAYIQDTTALTIMAKHIPEGFKICDETLNESKWKCIESCLKYNQLEIFQEIIIDEETKLKEMLELIIKYIKIYYYTKPGKKNEIIITPKSNFKLLPLDIIEKNI